MVVVLAKDKVFCWEADTSLVSCFAWLRMGKSGFEFGQEVPLRRTIVAPLALQDFVCSFSTQLLPVGGMPGCLFDSMSVAGLALAKWCKG